METLAELDRMKLQQPGHNALITGMKDDARVSGFGVGFQPVGIVDNLGRVLVRRDPDETEIRGVVIPLLWRKKHTVGTVLAVHRGVMLAGCVLRPCIVEPGDRVLFGKYAGTDIEWHGEKLTVMREDDLLAVIEP
jgi:chaperonin GroES